MTNQEPLSNLVLRQLRQEILKGEIRPGERIRQEDAAQRCGTSRIPVREALKQLQSEGLVTLTSHVGARVATLDLSELTEIYLIRELVEPYAIALSTPRLSDRDHEALRRYIEAMESVANVDDPSRWIELDRNFHLATYARADMPRLQQFIEGLWTSTQQYRRAYVRLPGRIEIAQAEHILLLGAIERHDAAEAKQLSLAHIRRTRLGLDEHPEVFAT